MQPQPTIVDGHMLAPTAPGLGVDIVEEAIARYPSEGNISPPNPNEEYVYFQARQKRASWLGARPQEHSEDFV
jgi:galactonate dehydratase